MKHKKKLFALSLGLLTIGAYFIIPRTALPEWVGLSGTSGAAEPGWEVEYVDGSGKPIQPNADSAGTLAKAANGWRNWFSISGSAAASKLVGSSDGSAVRSSSTPVSTKRR